MILIALLHLSSVVDFDRISSYLFLLGVHDLASWYSFPAILCSNVLVLVCVPTMDFAMHSILYVFDVQHRSSNWIQVLCDFTLRCFIIRYRSLSSTTISFSLRVECMIFIMRSKNICHDFICLAVFRSACLDPEKKTVYDCISDLYYLLYNLILGSSLQENQWRETAFKSISKSLVIPAWCIFKSLYRMDKCLPSIIIVFLAIQNRFCVYACVFIS